jgi:hypothetical protein
MYLNEIKTNRNIQLLLIKTWNTKITIKIFIKCSRLISTSLTCPWGTFLDYTLK